MLHPDVWVNVETAGFSSTSLPMQTPITDHLLVSVISEHTVYFPSTFLWEPTLHKRTRKQPWYSPGNFPGRIGRLGLLVFSDLHSYRISGYSSHPFPSPVISLPYISQSCSYTFKPCSSTLPRPHVPAFTVHSLFYSSVWGTGPCSPTIYQFRDKKWWRKPSNEKDIVSLSCLLWIPNGLQVSQGQQFNS